MNRLILFLVLVGMGQVHSYTLVFNSVPKCGTNLVVRLLDLLGDFESVHVPNRNIKNSKDLPEISNGQFYLLYHFPSTKSYTNIFSGSDYKGLFIYRDPRDGFVSMLHFIPKHAELFGKRAQLSFNQLFDSEVKRYFSMMMRLLPWTQLPNFLTIRFEDLVGSRGGGSDEAQLQTIYAVAQHLEIELTEEKAAYIVNNLFGGTWTFNKGQIGSWKDELSDKQKAYMYTYAKDAVKAYGYDV